MIIPLCKSERKRTECNNYRHQPIKHGKKKYICRNISGQVHRVTEGLIDDEQEGDVEIKSLH